MYQDKENNELTVTERNQKLVVSTTSTFRVLWKPQVGDLNQMGRGNRNKTGRLELNFEGWAKVSWMKEEEKKIIHKV